MHVRVSGCGRSQDSKAVPAHTWQAEDGWLYAKPVCVRAERPRSRAPGLQERVAKQGGVGRETEGGRVSRGKDRGVGAVCTCQQLLAMGAVKENPVEKHKAPLYALQCSLRLDPQHPPGPAYSVSSSLLVPYAAGFHTAGHSIELNVYTRVACSSRFVSWLPGPPFSADAILLPPRPC